MISILKDSLWRKVATTAGLLTLVLAARVPAAVTPSIDLGANFPSAANFQTFDPHDPTTPTVAERDVKQTRFITQTFRLGSDVAVNQIDFMFVRGFSGVVGQLRVFNVADTLAGDVTNDWNNALSDGFLADFNFTMPAGLDSASNVEQVLRLDLSGADQFTLPATTGNAGYGLTLSIPDQASDAFTWRFGDPGTGNNDNSYYLDGRISYDDFVATTTEFRRDGLFALQGPPTALQLNVDPVDGDVALTNPTENPISLNSYRITSGASLNNAEWNPISSQNISGFPAGNGTGNGWEVGPNVSSSELVEWYLQGDSTLNPGSSIYLGHSYNPAVNGQDLQFRYGSGDADVVGAIQYAPFVPNTGAVAGDYNNDGTVNAADYTVWRDHLGQAFQLTNEGPGQTPGNVTIDDYNFWKAHFGENAGSGALAPSAVPEPSSVLLAAIVWTICAWSRDVRLKFVPEPTAMLIVRQATLDVAGGRR